MTDQHDSAVDRWHTEPWTKWRIFELWGRAVVAIGWVAALSASAALVSREFFVMVIFVALAMQTLDTALPPGVGWP